MRTIILLIAISLSLASIEPEEKTPEQIIEVLTSDSEKEMNFITNTILFKVIFPLSKYQIGEENGMSCFLCEFGVSAIANLITEEKVESLYKFANSLCELVMAKNFCEPIIEQYGNVALKEIVGYMKHSGEFCQKLGYCPPTKKFLNATEYAEYLLKDKQEKEKEPIDETAKKLSFVQLTDIHYDQKYKEGTDAEYCGYSICCRDFEVKKGIPREDGPKAGKYGYPGICDTSEAMFDSFLDKVDELNPDFIIWSGDNTPHDVWVSNIINKNILNFLGRN